MTKPAENIIKSFEKLPPTEQREVATEILRRTIEIQLTPLSDDELTRNAEDIFLELDRREAADG